MPEITADNDHIVDIELVRRTEERLKSFRNKQEHHATKPLICRVPKQFHDIDGSAYVPRCWSIGPYHNSDERLQEKHKLYFLDYICKHFPATLEKYYEELQSREVEARRYYSGDVPLNTPSFLEMLLLDSCFILGTLKIIVFKEETGCVQNPNGNNPGFADEENSKQNTIQSSTARSDECNPHATCDSFASDFLHDLLLLENQIPMFVLQRIYNVARGYEDPNEHVASQLANRLTIFIPEIPIKTLKNDSSEKIHHLLHLLHWLLKPSEKQNGCSHVDGSWIIKRLWFWCQVNKNQLAYENLSQEKCQTEKIQQQEPFMRWRRAVEYHEAGVHFKLPRQSSHSQLDIEFENGELRIPKLIIDEKTSYIFGNLLAFEQETAQSEHHITTYITFMSQLLSMPDDVTLLSRKGIIEHHLGCDEDVSDLFKIITKYRFVELAYSGYLKPVCYVLEKHYKNHWNRWFAWLRHKHMTNPWLILGLLVAAIVAISAVVQALCSVIPLVHGKEPKGS